MSGQPVSDSTFDGWLQRAFALSSAPEARDLYDEWAPSYDSSLEKLGYASPLRAVESLMAYLPASGNLAEPLELLDAGCGTGLVGSCLSNAMRQHKRAFAVDGLDIAPGMLEVAQKKGVYRSLRTADLSQPLEVADYAYDVVLCVGTLTKGHVGAHALRDFVRVTKKDGLVVATVHEDVWSSGGFKSQVESMKDGNLVNIRESCEFSILEGGGKAVRLIVLTKM